METAPRRGWGPREGISPIEPKMINRGGDLGLAGRGENETVKKQEIAIRSLNGLRWKISGQASAPLLRK